MIEKFLLHQSQQDKSTYTITGYKIDLYQFSDWFNRTNEKPMKPDVVTPLDIKEYKTYLENRKLKPGTINRKLNVLRLFFHWCVKHGVVSVNPAERIKFAKQQPGSRAIKWLNRQQTFALLRAVEEQITLNQAKGNEKSVIIAKRNAAMIALMLNAGLRLSEIRDLRVDDIELRERSGKVIVRKGKGGKYREIPLNSDARIAVKSWLAVRPDETDFLLGGRFNERTVQYHLKRLARKAGLEHLTPHQLRHTFGKNLVDAQVSIDRVALLMGHSDINTTAIYTQPSETDLTDDVEKISWYD